MKKNIPPRNPEVELPNYFGRLSTLMLKAPWLVKLGCRPLLMDLLMMYNTSTCNRYLEFPNYSTYQNTIPYMATKKKIKAYAL